MNTGTPDISSGLHDLLLARRETLAKAEKILSLVDEFVQVALSVAQPHIRQHFKRSTDPHNLRIEMSCLADADSKKRIFTASCKIKKDGTMAVSTAAWYDDQKENPTPDDLLKRNHTSSATTVDTDFLDAAKAANRILLYWAQHGTPLEQMINAGFKQLEQAAPCLSFRPD